MAPRADGRIARLAIVGDVMLGRLFSRGIIGQPPEGFWGDTLPVLRVADAVVANPGCATSGRGSQRRRTPAVFHSRAEPSAVAVLKAVGVSYVSLANNHFLDYQEETLKHTLTLLDDVGTSLLGWTPT